MWEYIETALIGIDQKEITVTLSSIDSGVFAEGDLISQSAAGQSDYGIIFDAAVRENGGTAEVLSAVLTETKSGGVLQKGSILLILFDSYNLNINSNDPFVLGGLTTAANIIGLIRFESSNYVDIDENTAMCIGTIQQGYIKANNDTTIIKGVVISKDTKTYDNHSLRIKLIIHRH
jgi:hypothetical protein